MNQSLSTPVAATILSFIFCSSVFAQTIHKTTIFFPTDEYHLSSQNLQHLDSFFSSLSNIPAAYGFVISGHTDSVGTKDYNQRLSFNRAMVVAEFLKKKGFKQQQMQLSAKGFSTPLVIGNNEKENDKNRRVEIRFKLALPKMKSLAGVKNPIENLRIDENGGSITTSTGTRINVPPFAFVYENGSPVIGKVDIKYEEYREPIDFLLSDIPMHINTPQGAIPFNSAGMFTVNADQNNKPVFLQSGKKLDVNFSYNASVPDLNYYRYDTAKKEWILIKPITPATPLFMGTGVCMYSRFEPLICNRDADFKKVYMVLSGLRYSSPDDSSLYKFAQKRKLLNLQQQAFETSDKFKQMSSRMFRRFVAEVEKKGFLGKKSCKFYQVRGKNDKSSRMLDDVYFIAKNESSFDSIPENGFDDMDIQTIDNMVCSITFINKNKSSTINNLYLRNEKEAKENNTINWLKDFKTHCSSYKAKQELFADSAAIFKNIAKNYRQPIDDLYFDTWLLSLDSLQCFRSLHQPWMSADEYNMSFEDWLMYYNKNKVSMSRIYEEEKNKPGFEEMVINARNRRNIEIYITARGEAKLRFVPSDLSMSASFSVPTLGTYNCDQLNRLENPVNLFVNYKSKNGESINPVVAYLIDSKINGLLRYDGSYGLSPYKIAYSPSSTSRMILIGTNGEAYTVNSTAFSSIDPTNATKSYTLIAEPVKNVRSKQELKELLKL